MDDVEFVLCRPARYQRKEVEDGDTANRSVPVAPLAYHRDTQNRARFNVPARGRQVMRLEPRADRARRANHGVAGRALAQRQTMHQTGCADHKRRSARGLRCN
jgi:hypothetical protein